MKNEDNRTQQQPEEEKKKKRGIIILFTIIGIVLILFGAVYTGYYFYSIYEAKKEQVTTPDIAVVQDDGGTLSGNPIDFDALQAENDEQYAWLKVPGTNIDYPIVQSKVDDLFYLDHRASDKAYSKPGALYTESINHTTFEDRVTVIYGHNGYSGIMFTTLHYFEKSDFFNEHEYFYIYTPDSIKTYEIVSAFKYDNRHILNSIKIQEDAVFLDFMQTLKNPESTNKNVRTGFEWEPTLDDNIVILSTCIQHQASNRYLVCGVLINDEKTN